MAKVHSLSEEMQRIVDDLIAETNLDNFMEFRCFAVDKQSEPVKVKKANPVECKGFDIKDIGVIITVYEEVLEQMLGAEEEQVKLIIRDALSRIQYDSEKDKLKIVSPKIAMTINGYGMYGKQLGAALYLFYGVEEQLLERKKELDG